MTEEQVSNLNEAITYEEGKIYWVNNKNWSSKLWERLYVLGYKMTSHQSGLTDIYDNNNQKIVHGEIGRANALFRLAKVMQ
ncbi:hypothetical protein D3C78_1534010 [compost metagenome]